MTFGERVKEYRIMKGMTQQELANRVGFKHRSSINKIELGLQDIGQEKILQIADALDVLPEFLLFDKILEENENAERDKFWNMFNKLNMPNRLAVKGLIENMIQIQDMKL